MSRKKTAVYLATAGFFFMTFGPALALDYQAGPLVSQADAKAKCPDVCSKVDLKWNGNWSSEQSNNPMQPLKPGMSVCGCDKK